MTTAIGSRIRFDNLARIRFQPVIALHNIRLPGIRLPGLGRQRWPVAQSGDG
jgi:hypothetical protein